MTDDPMTLRALVPIILLAPAFIHCATQQVESEGSSGAAGNPSAGASSGGGGAGTVQTGGTPNIGMLGTIDEGGADGCIGGASACPVEPEPACGDGLINVDAEECDDANGDSGDGCTATCVLEADSACPTPGEPCVSTVKCADGKLTVGFLSSNPLT